MKLGYSPSVTEGDALSWTGVGAPGPVGRRARLLILVVAVAVVSAILGWALGTTIRSPAEAARDAAPPDPSLITAEVERRVLSSSVVLRGDGRFSDAADLAVDADIGEEDGQAARPVVTGRLPSVGADLVEGSIAVEVSGRPVFLLSGDFPMYRRLRPGITGPDVQQLEAALQRLGLFNAKPDQTFDVATEQAVRGLYARAGYKPVEPSAADRERLASARSEVTAARDALHSAKAALAVAARGPSRAEIVAAEGELAVARADLSRAIADRDEAVSNAAPEDRARVKREHDIHVLEAENRVAVATASLDDLLAPRDTTNEQAAVDEAGRRLATTQALLAALEAEIGTQVPRGEVVFLANLPRRVERVHLSLAAEPNGPVLTLSGAQPEVHASVSSAERRLIDLGDVVNLDDDALGIDMIGAIASVADTPGDDGTYAVRIAPSGDGVERLVGANVRVTIPVESTDGEVLAVPLAAVWTAPDGTSRVRVARGDGSTRDITVEVGLAAEGYVEIRPTGRALRAGDEVVLGLR